MIYRHEFRGNEYLTSVVGCSNPQWASESFHLEKEIRQRWWHVRPGDVVIDAGAGYGSYALTALACGASLVIAVEPNKETFFTLCGSVAANGYAPSRFLPLACVLGNNTGLVCGYDPMTCSAVAAPGRVMEHRMGFTVDSLCETYALDRLDWLKVDVEGMDLAVVVGSMAAVGKFLPRILIENHTGISPHARGKIGEMLVPLGYHEERETGGGANEDWSLWTVPSKHSGVTE